MLLLIKRNEPKFQNPPQGTEAKGLEEEQIPQHAGRSDPGRVEADLQRQAGSPGGWCKCECLFLLEEGRQAAQRRNNQESVRKWKEGALGQICRFRMCDVQFTSGVELRLKLTKGLGCTDACRGGSTPATPQTVSGISDTAFGGHLHQVRRSQ